MVLYFSPLVSALGEYNQGVVPDFFQMTPIAWIIFVVSIIARNAAIALLLAFLILPLEFLSSMVFDYLKEKMNWNKWINVFLAVFVSCIAASIVCLFLLPWIVPGLLYFIFFWHL